MYNLPHLKKLIIHSWSKNESLRIFQYSKTYPNASNTTTIQRRRQTVEINILRIMKYIRLLNVTISDICNVTVTCGGSSSNKLIAVNECF